MYIKKKNVNCWCAEYIVWVTFNCKKDIILNEHYFPIFLKWFYQQNNKQNVSKTGVQRPNF